MKAKVIEAFGDKLDNDRIYLPGNDYEFGTNQLGDTSVNFQQGVDRAGTKKK
jgi:hypothetical protein